MMNLPDDVSPAALDHALDPDYLTQADLDEAYDNVLLDAEIDERRMAGWWRE